MGSIKWLLNNFEELLSGLSLILVIICVFFGVIARYIFHVPLIWTNEFATLTFTWTVFMGSSVAFKRNMHIGIDLLVVKTPLKIRKLLVVFSNVIILVFFIFVFIYGAMFSHFSISHPSPILRIPDTYYLLSVPIAFFSMSIHQIRKLIPIIRSYSRKD